MCLKIKIIILIYTKVDTLIFLSLARRDFVRQIGLFDKALQQNLSTN
jgi:hypothetical protein